MKKFLKSPFNILSLFFTAIGIMIAYVIISTAIKHPWYLHCYEGEWEEWCIGYSDFMIPLIPLGLAVIFYFWGKRIVNKIENKQNNNKN